MAEDQMLEPLRERPRGVRRRGAHLPGPERDELHAALAHRHERPRAQGQQRRQTLAIVLLAAP